MRHQALCKCKRVNYWKLQDYIVRLGNFGDVLSIIVRSIIKYAVVVLGTQNREDRSGFAKFFLKITQHRLIHLGNNGLAIWLYGAIKVAKEGINSPFCALHATLAG